MSYLPRQGASYSKPYSLDRDNQRGDELDAGLNARLPPGILSGGGITVSAALEIELAAETVVWTAGLRFNTGVDPLPLTVAGAPSGEVYVWGLLTRTAANQNERTELDTYAFVLSYLPDDPTPPSEYHVPLAVLPLDGSGNIDAANVNANPLGKWANPPNRGFRSIDLAGSGDYTLSAAEARAGVLKLTGALTGARSLILPFRAGDVRLIHNATTGAFAITAKIAGGTGEAVPQGAVSSVYCDDTDIVVV